MWVVEGCNCLEGLKLEGPPLSTPSGAGKKFSCWQHAGSVVPGVAREGVALQGQSGAAPAAALCHQAGAGRDVGRLLAQFHPPNFPPWSLRGAVPPTVPLQFFFLKYVDPATYQILGNLKIVTTGLLLRVALNRQLSRLQWMALLLLMTGAATSQINTDCTAGVVQSVLHAPFMVSSAGALLQPCSGSSSPVCAPCWAVGAATAVAAAAASYASVQLCIPVRFAHTHSELPLPLPAAPGLRVWRGQRAAVCSRSCVHRVGVEEEQRHAVLAEHAAVRLWLRLQPCQPGAQVHAPRQHTMLLWLCAGIEPVKTPGLRQWLLD